jgi:cysteine desulfurase
MWECVAISIVILLLGIWLVGAQMRSVNVFTDYIYLDNNGTTPTYPDVYKAMRIASGLGNAASLYADDARAVNIIAEARLLSQLGGAQTASHGYKVIWTSGATESNNLYLRSMVDAYYMRAAITAQTTKQTDPLSLQAAATPSIPHIIISSIEHKSNIDTINQLTLLGRITASLIDPQPDGTINPMEVAYAIQPATIAISIMHVNNEIGSINNIFAIANIANARGVPFHSDIVQSIGKGRIPLVGRTAHIDAVSVSFHKLYGPMGIGALVVSPQVAAIIGQAPQMPGSQNDGLRGGTDNIAGIAGADIAMQFTFNNICAKNKHLHSMKTYILNYLAKNFHQGKLTSYIGQSDEFSPLMATNPYVDGNSTGKLAWPGEILILGNPYKTTFNTILVSFIKYGALNSHFCNVKLKDDLLRQGIIISVGSACNSASRQPSHVLRALKLPYIVRCGVIRISLGNYNTLRECAIFCNTLSNTLLDQII